MGTEQSVVRTRVALVGAGPIGIEVAVELKRAGLDYVHLEKGSIAATIAWFPQQMTFFSSTDRISIAGVPIQTVGQTKCSKELYLAYLRSIVQTFGLRIRTYEEVEEIERVAEGFRLRTRRADGEHVVVASEVILATGDTDRPRTLDVPGEDLPHVDHYFDEPHRYFQQRLVVVGGKNSAVEAALRCWHAGAEVTLSYRRDRFDPQHVKYWLLPELEGRIERGEIDCHYSTTVRSISPTAVTLERSNGTTEEVAADFVLLLTGYVADMSLFRAVGVDLEEGSSAPRMDERTMETNVPGLYVAGTAIAGTQASYRVFLENCHGHGHRIVAALTGAPPPAQPAPLTRPES